VKVRFLLVVLVLLCTLTGAGPQPKASGNADEQSIRALYERFPAAIAAKDLDAVMSLYTPDVVAFDAFPPRQYTGAAAYRRDYEAFFAEFSGPAKSEITDLHIEVAGSIAFAYGVDRWTVSGKDGQPITMVFRFTDVFRKTHGKWLISHEHLSFPVDATTGKADFTSSP
jgi:uncharacterized protein (TIGR02246 family)